MRAATSNHESFFHDSGWSRETLIELKMMDIWSDVKGSSLRTGIAESTRSPAVACLSVHMDTSMESMRSQLFEEDLSKGITTCAILRRPESSTTPFSGGR